MLEAFYQNADLPLTCIRELTLTLTINLSPFPAPIACLLVIGNSDFTLSSFKTRKNGPLPLDH